MKNALVIAVAILTSSCALPQRVGSTNTTASVEDLYHVATLPSCSGNMSTESTKEFLPILGPLAGAVLEPFASKLISKGIDKAADYLLEAAEKDRADLTKQFTDPAALRFRVQERYAPMGCLVVVVAPPGNGVLCSPSEKGNAGAAQAHWRSVTKNGVSDGCDYPTKLDALWSSWQLGKPKFYAEIELNRPEGFPQASVRGQVRRLYYPEALSGKKTSKGMSMALVGRSLTQSTQTKGAIAFEMLFDGTKIVPHPQTRLAERPDSFSLTGLISIPDAEAGSTAAFGAPVNLEVTLVESSKPRQWLQTLAKLVDKNRDKIKEVATPAPTNVVQILGGVVGETVDRVGQVAGAATGTATQVASNVCKTIQAQPKDFPKGDPVACAALRRSISEVTKVAGNCGGNVLKDARSLQKERCAMP